PLAGVGIEKVDGVVVGAEHHPGAALPLEHRWLTCPASAAPRALAPAVGRLAAEPTRGRVPPELRWRSSRDRAGSIEGARGVAPEREQTIDRVEVRLTDRRR